MNIKDMTLSLAQELYLEHQEKNIWKESPFLNLSQLTNDERGKFGELFLYNLLKENDRFDVDYDEDKNSNHEEGIFDIKIQNLRTEVKTSFRGTSNYTWQHEGVYNAPVWDRLVYIDVDLNSIYVTVIKYEDLNFDGKKIPVLNKKPTLRKNQKDNFKLDFSRTTIQNAKNANWCYELNLENINNEDFLAFLLERF